MRLDNLTLLVCLFMVSSLLSLAFARTWGAHRSLRGAGSFALAFLSAAGSCLLFAVVPPSFAASRFVNTVVGDSLVCCIFAFLLSGIERFFGKQRFSRAGWLIVAAASLLILWFTEVEDSMLARIVVLGIVGFAIRFLIGMDLLRQQPTRRHLRTLASLMFLYAFFSLGQAAGTLLTGAPRDYMQSDFIQTGILFLDVLFVVATGLLLFLLLNTELVMRLEEEAARDFLSGALNRRGIERVLKAEMERSRHYGEALCIGLVDLDHFKQLNDTRGHAAGDEAITAVAQTLFNALRAYDHVGRFGGDEFLVVLPDTLGVQAINAVERIHEDIAKLEGKLTLSIGLTSMTAGDEIASLLARADKALYEAKLNGRNCTRLCAPSEPAIVPKEHAGHLVATAVSPAVSPC
jgi:diguanylate cyclase (GGDEF)-like protein